MTKHIIASRAAIGLLAGSAAAAANATTKSPTDRHLLRSATGSKGWSAVPTIIA